MYTIYKDNCMYFLKVSNKIPLTCSTFHQPKNHQTPATNPIIQSIPPQIQAASQIRPVK